MLPSFGSRSSPADVPHLRPAGSSPQLRVTFGAGFGSPSPVMGLPVFAADWADTAVEPDWRYAVSTTSAQAPNATNGIRGLSIIMAGIIAQTPLVREQTSWVLRD